MISTPTFGLSPRIWLGAEPTWRFDNLNPSSWWSHRSGDPLLMQFQNYTDFMRSREIFSTQTLPAGMLRMSYRVVPAGTRVEFVSETLCASPDERSPDVRDLACSNSLRFCTQVGWRSQRGLAFFHTLPCSICGLSRRWTVVLFGLPISDLRGTSLDRLFRVCQSFLGSASGTSGS